MEPTTPPAATESTNEAWHAPLTKVTVLSKVTAAVVFITLPFVGFWVGYTNAPERIIEVPMSIMSEQNKQPESPGGHVDVPGKNGEAEIEVLSQAIANNRLPNNFIEMATATFSYKGAFGKVSQLCLAGSLVREVGTDREHEYCSGIGAVVIDYENNKQILGVTASGTAANEYRKLHSVVDEGYHATSSPNTIGNHLVLAFTKLPCVGVPQGDLCEEIPVQDLMVFDMEQRSPPSWVKNVGGNFSLFVNPSESKALLVVKDKLGAGYQLFTLEVASPRLTPISDYISATRFPAPEDVTWKGDSTVVVFGNLYAL